MLSGIAVTQICSTESGICMKTDFIYRQLAWLYDYPFGVLLREGHEVVGKELPQTQGLKVAELGIGPGHSLAYYPPGTELSGIDISPNMIAKAKERLAELPHLKADLQVMDATATNLPDNAYDVVVSFSVITVVDHPEKLLQEAVRICKPGGKIFIIGRLKRPGLSDWLWRKATHRLSLFLFGFGTTMDASVYDAIISKVDFLSRKQVNHVGPFFTLSDVMILQKKV